MARTSEDAPAVCPVDPAARAAWLDKSRDVPSKSSSSNPLVGDSCDSSKIDQSEPAKAPPLPKSRRASKDVLDSERAISSIPRGNVSTGASTRSPANNEHESGKDASTGNWIYPSEQMFFNAMKRKNYDPKAEDMKTIIPIHNAVNERVWMEIRKWEKGWGADRCGGPRLDSFSGTALAMTPKARFNTLLGYHAPFDRHDWVVDRCGTKVGYVIDFYSGKDEGKAGKSLNFYLDVRPKLDTWEGWKMRALRLVGLG